MCNAEHVVITIAGALEELYRRLQSFTANHAGAVLHAAMLITHNMLHEYSHAVHNHRGML